MATLRKQKLPPMIAPMFTRHMVLYTISQVAPLSFAEPSPADVTSPELNNFLLSLNKSINNQSLDRVAMVHGSQLKARGAQDREPGAAPGPQAGAAHPCP